MDIVMKFFSANWNDDDFEDEGPMFGGSERYEERKQKLERAKEIDSGLIMGTFDKDEEIWEMVKKLKEKVL
jgi:hypothetical protein